MLEAIITAKKILSHPDVHIFLHSKGHYVQLLDWPPEPYVGGQKA